MNEQMRQEFERRTTVEHSSRRMFVARLENLAQTGHHHLTVAEVLALLNDCDMLAARE